MNVKQKINYFGYDEFKRNIPIKLEDIELPLSLEDQHELNHNWSFLRMNHDFIELIDQYYARLGKGLSVFIFCLPFILSLFLFFLIDFYFILTLILVVLFYSLYPVYMFDRGKPKCRPIVFNRHTQKVYFYINEQEYVTS